MSDLIMETRQLSKIYANGRGCRDITLQIGKGEAFGFLGPNGAGKSTLVKMLVGLTYPTSGEALLFGCPIGSIDSKRQIGYLPELYRYQEWLTGEEVIHLHAKQLGMDRAAIRRQTAQLLEEVGIGARGKDRVKHYSKGMQQRLGLACALVGDPQLLFLDEPSSAMDPVGRFEVRALLQQLKERKITLFLNSHSLEDVELLCDRVALLNNGTIMKQGTVSELLHQKTRWHLRVGGFDPLILEWLRDSAAVQVDILPDKQQDGQAWCWLDVELEDEEQIGWLNQLLITQGITLYEVHKVNTKLETWFVQEVSGLNHRGERT